MFLACICLQAIYENENNFMGKLYKYEATNNFTVFIKSCFSKSFPSIWLVT